MDIYTNIKMTQQKKLWNAINQLKELHIPYNKTLKNPQEIAEVFNDYYIRVCQNLGKNLHHHWGIH